MEYDPLLAKLIGYGESRLQAIERLRRAVDEYFVGGIKTNLPLFRQILADEEFVRGKTDTGYLARMAPRANTSDNTEVAAIAAAIFAGLESGENRLTQTDRPSSNWRNVARTESVS